MRSIELTPGAWRMPAIFGAVVIVMTVLIAGCEDRRAIPDIDDADEDLTEVEEAPEASASPARVSTASLTAFAGTRHIPDGLEPILAAELASMWTQCGDTLVTAYRNRRGRAHPHGFIEAGGLSVRVRRTATEDGAAELPPGVDWSGTVQLRAATHRIYQRPDRPVDPESTQVTRTGWNDWIEDSTPLPGWSAQRRNGQWVITSFMPSRSEERARRYRVQHTAVDCAQVPAR